MARHWGGCILYDFLVGITAPVAWIGIMHHGAWTVEVQAEFQSNPVYIEPCLKRTLGIAERFPQQKSSTSLEGVERIKTSSTSLKRKLTAVEKFRSIAVPLLACLTVLAERKLFKISALVCCKINCDVMKWRWESDVEYYVNLSLRHTYVLCMNTPLV
jgi:hypothetical protein